MWVALWVEIIMANLKSARSVQTITDVGYHRCAPGLYLQVVKRGTKSWLFRFKSPVTEKPALPAIDLTHRAGWTAT